MNNLVRSVNEVPSTAVVGILRRGIAVSKLAVRLNAHHSTLKVNPSYDAIPVTMQKRLF